MMWVILTQPHVFQLQIFLPKKEKKIEKNKGQNNSKSISHQKINVDGLEIDPNLT